MDAFFVGNEVLGVSERFLSQKMFTGSSASSAAFSSTRSLSIIFLLMV